jgi:hypothetical protein
MFKSESDMQGWLQSELENNDGLVDIIINVDEFEKYEPSSLEERKVKESYAYCLESLITNVQICANENISLKPGDILKPDFLLYSSESESIVIIELKNQDNAAREAGTEFGAYANEVKSYVPLVSDGDIINVIISTNWSVLLRHYIYHEIFWQQRNLLCLEPTAYDGEKKLRIVEINRIIEGNISLKLSDRHLGGYHICLYDHSLYHKNPDYSRLDKYLEQMKTAIQGMGSRGSSLKSHGFAFLWTDDLLTLAPYVITVVNVAPFQSLERLFHDEKFKPNKITESIIRNVIIESDPSGQGISLNSIADKGISFLENFCSPKRESFNTWYTLKNEIVAPTTKLISFVSWGIFGELFYEKILNEYLKNNLTINVTDPELGLQLISELIDPNYDFIDLNLLYENDEEE